MPDHHSIIVQIEMEMEYSDKGIVFTRSIQTDRPEQSA